MLLNTQVEEFGGFPSDSAVKNPSANAGDSSSIPGSGRSTGKRIGYPLQYPSLENSMNRGDSWAIVHGVRKTDTTE